MNGLLAGKVAVVTGANRGIGRAIAATFVAEGASVAACARDRSTLRSVRSEVDVPASQFLTLDCDITDAASVEAVAAAAAQEWGKVDIVVANAGITGAVRPLFEMTYDEWRECIVTNLDGVFLTFRPFIAGMTARGSGSLIAISSMTGKRPLAKRAAYAAAKMGVIGLVRSLALELGPSGVRVNSVCPGVVDGERLRRVVHELAQDQGISDEQSLAQFTANAALRRTTRALEVAHACVFLASDLGAGITGEDMNVSAGLVMY